jgi:uncharacterized SAM-binding protein YcdF (DUF218 family)
MVGKNFIFRLVPLYHKWISNFRKGRSKVGIPKFPDPPAFTKEQIDEITKLTFLNRDDFDYEKPFDLLFVFGGYHPEIWETAKKAYDQGLARLILVTGGYKEGATRHESWTYGTTPESRVIKRKLIELGVPEEHILIEDRSTSSLENVLFAKEIFDFTQIRRLLFVSKAFASGRQWRTLIRHLPKEVYCAPYHAYTSINKKAVTETGWMHTYEHRQIVYGEYLRIMSYSRKGDIEPFGGTIPGLPVADAVQQGGQKKDWL